MTDAARRIVVVGAGISGLAAAHAISRAAGDAVQVTVLDKAPVVGGHLRIGEVAGIRVDVGAESLLNRRPEAVALVRDVGLGAEQEHPAVSEARLWAGDALVPLPARTVMGVPADPDALADVLSAAEIVRVAAEPELPGLPLRHDVAIGRLVTDRMGPAVTERLVGPLLGAVYAGWADRLSLRAVVPALADAVGTHGSLLDAARAVLDAQRAEQSVPVFAGIRGGVGRLPAAVVAHAGLDVRTSATVRRISRTETGWRVEAGPVPAPGVFEADAVVVAVPAAPAARMLRDVVPVAAAELAAVEYASVAIVTLALPRAAFPAPPRSAGYVVPPTTGRRTTAVTFSSVKWAWLGKRAGADLVIVRVSFGRHGAVADLQHDDSELVQTARAELGAAMAVTGAPVDALVSRWGGALPQYAVGHAERMARTVAAVEAVPGLAVCGAAYQGVGIAACVASGLRAAGTVLRSLPRVPVSGA